MNNNSIIEATENKNLTVEQRNANAKKEAMQAAKNAILSLYKNDRVAFLHATQFTEKGDNAYTEDVTYNVEKVIDGKTETVETSFRLRVSLFDFIEDRDCKKSLRDRVAKIADLSSDSTKEARAEVVKLVKNVVFLLGMKDAVDSVNERDAKRIMRNAYRVTDKNDDSAKESEVRRSIQAMLWAIVKGHETVNAYRATQTAKKATQTANGKKGETLGLSATVEKTEIVTE